MEASDNYCESKLTTADAHHKEGSYKLLRAAFTGDECLIFKDRILVEYSFNTPANKRKGEREEKRDAQREKLKKKERQTNQTQTDSDTE